MNTPEAISISNIMAVKELTSEPPAAGGVVVLRGRNGAGKTHALTAIAALAGVGPGSSALGARDGTGSGTAAGLGARITIGRRTTRAGEAVVDAIDGTNPAQLIDPGIKDPAAADQRRLAALGRLKGTKADAEAIARDLGIDLACTASARTMALRDDLPAFAGSLKRDLEAISRKHEDEATNLDLQATACRPSEGVDITQPHDEAALRGAHRTAYDRVLTLRAAAETARLAAEANQAAAEMLVGLQAPARSNMDMAAAVEDAEARIALSVQLVQTERERLAKLQGEWEQAERYHAAVQHAENVRAAARDSYTPTEAEIRAAQEATEAAALMVERGAVIRDALKRLDQGRGFLVQATEVRATGDRVRGLANSLEALVAKRIGAAEHGISVRDGRMFIKHARGEILFSELSAGERARVAIEIAIASGGPRPLLVLDQEFWEGLDPANRREIRTIAIEKNALIYTAEADDGDLRAEEF